MTPNDISKMLIKQYTGWWDDIPSNWTPAIMEDQGEMMIELSGASEHTPAPCRQRPRVPGPSGRA